MLLLFPVMLVMLMTSCLKDNFDQGTIVLMGTESDVKPIDSVIPDTLLSFITNGTAMGSVGALSLPRGNMPPDIQGEYIFCPIELCADNGYGVPRNDTLFFRFGGGDQDQHNMTVSCDLYGDVMEKGDIYHRKSQPKAYVMGNGNNFTAYFTLDYDCEFQGETYKIKRGYVIMGTVSSAGIDHAVMACVNISVDEVSGQGYVNPPQKDYIYVYRVKTFDNQFGLAQRYQWY